ncbi:hypothetical protein BO82DRAFT_157245 [Aspergillus uvarum CBS 121591]|uniref:Uncharacterized protein n=1 Tax=Aspergillus uvarum CBS 121591 TaxID=1448315 RepID=A0A319CSB9_9EURO|nr:hypothetical protein BO82DRAFT_157245 [Aspergillus uvarum CBS 121591]PYH78458.1 hypothetical protein BO82DRAFT_157245 [Aspergillus uvarum CBS 121591]
MGRTSTLSSIQVADLSRITMFCMHAGRKHAFKFQSPLNPSFWAPGLVPPPAPPPSVPNQFPISQSVLDLESPFPQHLPSPHLFPPVRMSAGEGPVLNSSNSN